MSEAPSLGLRRKWLNAMLPAVPFDGWTQDAAARAAREAALSDAEQAFAAPRGVADLLQTFFDDAEAEARARMEREDLSDLRIRDRVSRGIEIWLNTLEPNREAVRRAVARGFLPWQMPVAAGRSWSIADMVWHGAGDKAEDYNRYTKRGLLAAILPPIILYWLDEPDEEAVKAHIGRHVERAMRAGQWGGKLLGPVLKRFG